MISPGSRIGSLRPGTASDTRPGGGEPGADLVAHHLHRGGRRSDERRAGGGHGPGEGGVLGEEPVAGVYGVGSASPQGSKYRVGGEVALGRGPAAQGVRLVGKTDVQSVAVELGVDRDGRDPEFAAGPDDPHRDLAAIRDQHLLEHDSPSSI